MTIQEMQGVESLTLVSPESRKRGENRGQHRVQEQPKWPEMSAQSTATWKIISDLHLYHPNPFFPTPNIHSHQLLQTTFCQRCSHPPLQILSPDVLCGKVPRTKGVELSSLTGSSISQKHFPKSISKIYMGQCPAVPWWIPNVSSSKRLADRQPVASSLVNWNTKNI